MYRAVACGFVLVLLPLMKAGTIVTAACMAGPVSITNQTASVNAPDPATASCDANAYPATNEATASGTVALGGMSGSVWAYELIWTAEAELTASYDWTVTTTTTVTWNMVVNFDGPYGNALINVDGQGYLATYNWTSNTWTQTVTQTLAPGVYTVSVDAYVWDEGGLTFNIYDPPSASPAPEPGTFALAFGIFAALPLRGPLRRAAARRFSGVWRRRAVWQTRVGRS